MFAEAYREEWWETEVNFDLFPQFSLIKSQENQGSALHLIKQYCTKNDAKMREGVPQLALSTRGNIARRSGALGGALSAIAATVPCQTLTFA